MRAIAGVPLTTSRCSDPECRWRAWPVATVALRWPGVPAAIEPNDPLEAAREPGTAGVRDHIQVVQQVMTLAPEVSGELKASIADGLERKPGWKALEKVKAWLEL